MKCLIVRKQYLDLILSGLKIWEMRSAWTKIRGTIGLIEAGTGTVVGTVDLTGVLLELPEDQRAKFFNAHRVHDLQLLAKWRFPWVLENARRFETPVAYKHPRGAMIWVDVEMKDEVGTMKYEGGRR